MSETDILAEKLNLLVPQVSTYIYDMAQQNLELYTLIYAIVIMIGAGFIVSGGLFLISYIQSKSRSKYIALVLAVVTFVLAAFLIGYSVVNIIDWHFNSLIKTQAILLRS